ncbi:MBL fold metallo-hydrolase [Massilia sp. IC2-477]|uniref:MBL fold metallo-hydrolase n=1 Tax=Massilia sp. IC2-477 TaxID=2887198 RepID=UPI001D0F4B33|nr:MBL fold metallo-hydrolase [Massilia sp. IC2-477]MCC2957431.1 MBL fold metallo-hydrolase [Massilia sp. IC2-477]
MQRLFRVAAFATVLLAAGCSSVNPYYDASKSHHRPQGFANNYAPNPAYQRPVSTNTGFFAGWAGRIRNWTSDGAERAPLAAVPKVEPDLGWLQQNRSETALTWIGHATFLLQTGNGVNILTDPVFDERASPVSFAGPKRLQAPGVALDDLPHIDAVLISHSHYDHLSLDSLRALYRQKGGAPMFYAPLGIDLWLARHVTDGDRSRIVRLDWWDKASYRGLELQLLPVQHWSSRTPWDRNESLWGAWAVTRPGFAFFFSGDLGYSRDIQDIAARFPDGFDLAAIGIGAYQPVWYRNSHVSPDEAVRIHRELRVRRSVGMHWGTFPMGQERIDQAPRDLAIARQAQGVADDAFGVLAIGETLRLGPRAPAASGAP